MAKIRSGTTGFSSSVQLQPAGVFLGANWHPEGNGIAAKSISIPKLLRKEFRRFIAGSLALVIFVLRRGSMVRLKAC